MASGKVCTGFSKPYVAVYSNTGTSVSYSNGMELARGVNVTITPESSDNNNFYANNVAAESANGQFTGGTVDLTVDGLLTAAEKLIMGLPAAVDGWTAYGASQAVPHVGLGFIVRYQSEGTVTYVPFVLPKVIFNTIGTEAATQEDEIDWQTQSLTAQIKRDDTADQNWKLVGTDYSSEALAEAALKAKLGITPVITT